MNAYRWRAKNLDSLFFRLARLNDVAQRQIAAAARAGYGGRKMPKRPLPEP
jgi:hypothetical protein